MDFDFGTLIYIILGIVYFIFTSANKNKKKALPKVPEAEAETLENDEMPPVQRKTFEELLEEFTTGGTFSKESDLDEQTEPLVIEEQQPLVSESKPLPVFQKHERMKEDFTHFEEFEEEEVVQSPYAEMLQDMDSI